MDFFGPSVDHGRSEVSFWYVLQIAVNLFLGLGLAVLWLRFRRPPKEDPRLSRGLQLLQSKISVLEDLSDRTDLQVKQLTNLLDQKTRLLQTKIFDAEKQMQLVDQSMHKSLEVAEIFQDKIPHQEIIERQNTIKYVKAARMAHGGSSLDEIAEAVDLPREQLAFIAKVNQEQLMFDDEQLPEWAKSELEAEGALEFSMPEQMMVEDSPALERPKELYPNFEPPREEYENLKKLGDEFRNVCETFDKEQRRLDQEELKIDKIKIEAPSQLVNLAKKMTNKIVSSAGEFLQDRKNSDVSAQDQELKIEQPRPVLEAEVFQPPQIIQPAPSPVLPQVQAAATPAPQSARPTQAHQALNLAAIGTAAAPASTNPFVLKPKNPNPEVRPVRFPRIDMNDNLG